MNATSDIDPRLFDELNRSAIRFGMLIYVDDFRLMPRRWIRKLARCLERRVELRQRLRTHFYQSVEEYGKDADLTQELDKELYGMLNEVADTRATRN
jgi:hypothetical protein